MTIERVGPNSVFLSIAILAMGKEIIRTELKQFATGGGWLKGIW
jgi:hypothetical protein